MAEIGRRVVHASGVALPALFLVDLITWSQFKALLLLGSLIAIILEIARLRLGLDWWIYDRLTRPYEAESIAGYALYMFSITVVGLIFQPEVALPAMMMLMLGDPISGYLSTGGLQTVKAGKSMIAMFIVSFLIALPFALSVLAGTAWGIGAAIVAACCATIADGVKPIVGGYVIDDNLTIPPAAAVALWFVYLIAPT